METVETGDRHLVVCKSLVLVLDRTVIVVFDSSRTVETVARQRTDMRLLLGWVVGVEVVFFLFP